MSTIDLETVKVYGFAGLPASGKTTAALVMAGESGGKYLGAGKLIREMAEAEGLKEPTSDELGDFAAQKRNEHGNGFFGKMALEYIIPLATDEGPVVVDSFRHINGYHYVSEYPQVDAELIFMNVPRQDRYDRLVARGRDDEGEFTMDDLINRDSTEMHRLGLETIIESDEADHIISNKYGRRYLYKRIMEILDE